MRIATFADEQQAKELLLRHWDNVSDDYSDPYNIFFAPDVSLCFIDDGFLATVIPMTNVMADAHIVSEREDTRKLILEAIDYLKEHTVIRNLLVNIPIYNRRCYKMSLGAGFDLVGVNPKSYMKNGELIDQYVLARCL